MKKSFALQSLLITFVPGSRSCICTQASTYLQECKSLSWSKSNILLRKARKGLLYVSNNEPLTAAFCFLYLCFCLLFWYHTFQRSGAIPSKLCTWGGGGVRLSVVLWDWWVLDHVGPALSLLVFFLALLKVVLFLLFLIKSL